MAAATYTTDLTTVNILDTTTPTIGEPTGSTAGTTIAIETDHFVVSTASISKIFNATGVGGLGFLNGTTVTVPADGAVYMWTNFLAPNAISVQSSGGMQLLIGQDASNYKRFYVYGDDTVPYGGWQVNAVNPANTGTNIVNQGTPNGTWQYFGMAANVEAAVARGYPLAWDAVRAGRGSIIAVNGDLANGYATFAGIATKNDLNTTGDFNRWGIFSYSNGTYLLQGRLALGQAGTAVDFRDSNRAIFIKNTEFVTAAFNQIEILNAASRVDWTGISISALGTVSKGRVIVTDNADVNISGCTFTDMDSFTFLSNSTVDSTVFRRCGLVSPGGGLISNSTFDKPSGTVAVSTSTLATLADCTFISDGTGHAVDLGTISTTQSMTWDCVDSGYTNTTGNRTILVNVNNGITLTINVGTGKSTPTVQNSGTGTVNVVSGQVTLQLTGIVVGSDVVILSAGTTTELANVDANSTATYDYTYTYAANTYIDVCVYKSGYVPFVTRGYLLGDTNGSLPIKQVLDRNFNNPV